MFKTFWGKIKDKLIETVEWVHLKFFGHPMSDTMREFLRNLSWSFFGGIISGVILFIVNILAGRWLGPEMYGKYNLIVAITSCLVIFMTIGLDVSVIRFVSISKNISEKILLIRFVLKRVFVLILITVIISLGVIILLRGNDINIFNSVYVSAVILAIFLSLRMVTDGILRGLGLFLIQAKIRLIESVAVLVFFIAGFYFLYNSFNQYVFATMGGYVTFSMLTFLYIKKNFFADIDSVAQIKIKRNIILKYGLYAMIGSFASFLFMGSDKILIGSFIDQQSVGVYSAYFTVSIVPVTLLQVIIINVFFPMISKSLNKQVIFKKINKLFLISAVPMFGLLFISSYIALLLFGNKYSRDVILIGLFSVYAILFLVVGVKQWLLASISDSSVLDSSIIAIVSGFIQAGLMFILLKNGFNLHFVICGIIGAYSIFVILNNYFIKINLKKYET